MGTEALAAKLHCRRNPADRGSPRSETGLHKRHRPAFLKPNPEATSRLRAKPIKKFALFGNDALEKRLPSTDVAPSMIAFIST